MGTWGVWPRSAVLLLPCSHALLKRPPSSQGVHGPHSRCFSFLLCRSLRASEASMRCYHRGAGPTAASPSPMEPPMLDPILFKGFCSFCLICVVPSAQHPRANISRRRRVFSPSFRSFSLCWESTGVSRLKAALPLSCALGAGELMVTLALHLPSYVFAFPHDLKFHPPLPRSHRGGNARYFVGTRSLGAATLSPARR